MLSFVVVAGIHYVFIFGLPENENVQVSMDDRRAYSEIIERANESIKKRKPKLSDFAVSGNEKISLKSKSDLNYESLHEFTYCLPFKPGNAYLVSQTEGQTHKNNSKNAIDFVIPTGAGVYAARSGRVIHVIDHYKSRGRDESYLRKANQVLVRHADDTLGLYAHLDHKGAKVKVGEYVKAGDHIGFSGDTGYSAGAHLHFEVFKDARQKSLPVRFWTSESPSEKLKARKKYFASRDCVREKRELDEIAKY